MGVKPPKPLPSPWIRHCLLSYLLKKVLNKYRPRPMFVSLMKRIFLVNSPVGLRSLCSFFMSKYLSTGKYSKSRLLDMGLSPLLSALCSRPKGVSVRISICSRSSPFYTLIVYHTERPSLKLGIHMYVMRYALCVMRQLLKC